MRQGVLELREFYATPLGRVAREMVSRKVAEAWGDARGLDLLALGYATPFLDGLGAEAGGLKSNAIIRLRGATDVDHRGLHAGAARVDRPGQRIQIVA